jgi:hypothetical protein
MFVAAYHMLQPIACAHANYWCSGNVNHSCWSTMPVGLQSYKQCDSLFQSSAVYWLVLFVRRRDRMANDVYDNAWVGFQEHDLIQASTHMKRLRIQLWDVYYYGPSSTYECLLSLWGSVTAVYICLWTDSVLQRRFRRLVGSPVIFRVRSLENMRAGVTWHWISQ